MLPPPVILILGYWIARGFRPDFGKINKRVGGGVALMPVWIMVIWMDMGTWPPKNQDQLVGTIAINLIFLGLFALRFLHRLTTYPGSKKSMGGATPADQRRETHHGRHSSFR